MENAFICMKFLSATYGITDKNRGKRENNTPRNIQFNTKRDIHIEGYLSYFYACRTRCNGHVKHKNISTNQSNIHPIYRVSPKSW